MRVLYKLFEVKNMRDITIFVTGGNSTTLQVAVKADPTRPRSRKKFTGPIYGDKER